MTHLAEYIVNRLFSAGLSLDSARSIVGNGPAGDRIVAAGASVDRLIREIRDHLFARRSQETQPGLHRGSVLDERERPARATDRAALLQERMARTARALRASTAEYAALLEQRAEIARQPGRMDYQVEIKRWQAFAYEADEMARRWEACPPPPGKPSGEG